MSDENITVLIKNGQIVVNFEQGNLHRDSINLSAEIKRLPDVASTTIQRNGNILVTLSSASNAASLQRRIAELADAHGTHVAQPVESSQMSLF